MWHIHEAHVIGRTGVGSNTHRLTCHLTGECTACQDPYSGQKKFESAEIPAGIQACTTKQADDGTIFLSWTRDLDGYSNDHITIFKPEFFVRAASSKLQNELPDFEPWDKAVMEQSLTKVPYTRYMETEQGFEEILEVVYRYGLAIITGVPEDERAVERVGEQIGPLRNTFYGRTWDVKDKPRAENVAYTSHHLGLHMDLLQVQSRLAWTSDIV